MDPECCETKHVKFLVPRFNSTDPNNPDAYECVSERAPDYYGIGVRLGVYFSWWTAWLANTGMPQEVMGALDQNAVFLFANIIALVRCTITFVVTQLDALVMFHLGMGTILSVNSIWGYRTCYYATEGPQGTNHFGGFGTHLRLLLSGGICVFSCWLWLHGIEHGNPDLINDTGPCGKVYTFMFVKLDSTGGIRIFYLLMSLAWTIYFGVMLAASPIAGWIRLKRMITLKRLQRYRTSHRLHIATGYTYRELRYVFYVLRVFNFFWILWSMVTIEMVLNYNHVQAVLGPDGRIYFPSQLIPMIIGAFSLTRLLYKKFEKVRGEDIEPTVIQEAPVQGEPQPLPKGKDFVKLFSPPTGVAQKASSFKSPEDEDLDQRVDGDPKWIRYLVAYLPWLSLLPRWEIRTNEGFNQSQQGNHDEEKQVSSPNTMRIEFGEAAPRDRRSHSEHLGSSNDLSENGKQHPQSAAPRVERSLFTFNSRRKNNKNKNKERSGW